MARVLLKGAHSSAQFSDTPDQQRLDARRLARRMDARNWHFLTGTEAGSKSVIDDAWRDVDQNFGLRFHKGRTGDVWIVTQRDLFHGSYEVEWHKVLDGVAGRYADRGFLRVTGHCPLVNSELTILSSHWLTDDTDHHMKNGPGNRRLADALERIGRKHAQGKALCFVGLDANRSERERGGVVLNAPFTSLAHELHKIQNTGHGAIDALCSANADHRVRGNDFDVFDDSEFRLASDHWLCEGSWHVAV